MLLRLYLYTLFFLTLIFWAAFCFLIFYVSPYKADTLTFSIFFVSLFFALLTAVTLFGVYLRLKFSKKETVLGHFLPSFRQGALFAIFIIGILGFSALKIFTWWTVSLLFAILLFLELIFRAR